VALFEPGETQGEVVGDIFEYGGQAASADTPNQSLQGGADQRQRTGRICAAQATTIFAPRVALTQHGNLSSNSRFDSRLRGIIFRPIALESVL
jgi:hypothetical protein